MRDNSNYKKYDKKNKRKKKNRFNISSNVKVHRIYTGLMVV